MELSFHGTWIDGYIPGIEKMKRLVQRYRDLDRDLRGLPREYGFSQTTKGWTQEDYFGSIASAIRDKFDRDNLPPDIRPTPCFIWLAKVDKKLYDPKMMPLYEEYRADPRKERYYHLITVHEECLVAEDCFQQVINKLYFETKPEAAYVNRTHFMSTVYKALTRFVEITAAPWLEVERQLEDAGNKVISAG